MKKLILLTLFIATSFQTISAQENDDLELITSGKWYIEYIEVSGEKMEIPADIQKSNWVVFHSDGKEEGMEEGRKYEGKWKYDALNKVIKTDDMNGKVDQKLLLVNKNKLAVSLEKQGTKMIIGMKK